MAVHVMNINKKELEIIDKMAEKEMRTRSGYLQKIILEFLQKELPKEEISKKKTIKVKKKEI